MSNPPVFPTQDPVQDAVTAWNQSITQYETQKKSLEADIQMMDSASTGVAFLIAAVLVMPAAMQEQGDKTGICAQSENIGSALRSFVAYFQDIFNTGSKIEPVSGAQDFVTALNAFSKDVQQGFSQGWLNQDTQSNMLTAIDTIYSTFGITPDENPGEAANTVMRDMASWFNNPGSKTPNPNISAVQDSFQTLNNSVSAISTTATTQEQYESNIYNQVQATVKNMLQTIAKLALAEIEMTAKG